MILFLYVWMTSSIVYQKPWYIWSLALYTKIYKKVTKVKEILRDSYESCLLVYDRNINQKLLSSQMVWEMKNGPLVHWIENKKKPFYCNFISHTHIPKFGVLHVSHYIIQVRWLSMFVRCVYTLACCPLGGVTQIVRLHTYFFFWHFRCLLSRKDNKDKWQQNTKSPTTNSIYTR